MKIINITDIKVKELRVGFDEEDNPVLSILYAEVSDTGEEMKQQWSDPIKAPSTLLKGRLTKVVQSAVDKVKVDVGL